MLKSTKRVQYILQKVNKQSIVHIQRNSSTFQDDSYQFLHKSKVTTLHFQDSLLRLAIPELEKTCARYLRSQEALLTPEKYKETKRITTDFQNGPAIPLQDQLKSLDRNNKHTSYISAPWFDMYLSDRAPIVLNYNPFLGFLPEETPGYGDPVIRASNILVSSARFMNTLRNSILSPEVFHLNPKKSDTPFFWKVCRLIPGMFASYGAYAFKAFPLDMSQFGNLFNSTRIPDIGKDYLKVSPDSKHMLIMKNGNFYIFDIFNDNGKILSPSEIHACVKYISEDNSPPPKFPIGILTSENRDTWAKVREELLAEGNEEALELIDTAAFNLVFDDVTLDLEPEKTFRNFLYGDGKNRWFDKSFSLIFSKDGQTALNFEHAWGDGVAVMRYFNEVAKDAVDKRHIHPDSVPANIDVASKVRKLDFRLTPSIEDAITKAIKSYEASTSALGVDVLESDVFGKNMCKKQKVSPDAMMQLGFQMAYYMQNGEFVPTYESCSTSAFKHGRTETVRPATLETTAFTKAVTSQNAPSQSELLGMLKKCSDMHGSLTKDAAMGQGWDRHLFGLRKMSESTNTPLPAFYDDPAYQNINKNILSTSTLPSNLISFGGFAPVVRNGFGVGYQIQDDRLGIVLSSYPPHRDGKGFVECAEKSYKIIHDILMKS